MTDEFNNLLRLKKQHIKPASEVLARAFQKFPLADYVYPDEYIREQRLPYFFQYVLYYCLKYGEIYTTSSEIEGVAAWMKSDFFPMTMARMLRSVPLHVMFKFGRDVGMQMKSFGEYVDGIHRRVAPFPHWFLQVLGVDPVQQGKGFSSKLLRPMFDRIDKEGIPCYLETLDEVDVRIYEHFDFKVMDKSTVPGTNITNWAMLRDVK